MTSGPARGPEPAPAPDPEARRDGALRVGQLAGAVGLSHRTVRYYDEQGLLSAQRSAGNYRLYEPADVARMRAIMAMKPLGFTLEEMRRLLAALEGGGAEHDVLAAFRDDVARRRGKLVEHLALADALGERLDVLLGDGGPSDAT